jgi:uncharacterized membrane protein (DUF373 family)
VGAAAALVGASVQAWKGWVDGSALTEAFSVLEQLLLVLILLEILHTVRASIRSETLLMEPFLVVGLIASVRRVLVITLQAAHALQEGQGSPQSESLFRNTMIELGLIGFLILVFVIAIYLLRRAPPHPETRL